MIQHQIVQVTEVLLCGLDKDVDFMLKIVFNDFRDVTLACEDNPFEAHKIIISSHSLGSVFCLLKGLDFYNWQDWVSKHLLIHV